MSEQEKKDKRYSLIISGLIHASLIALFFVLMAWRAPDPPIPEYGIELNFGLEEQGGGDTEREADAQIEDTDNEEAPDAEEEVEPVEQEPSEETEVEPEPVEEPTEEITESEPEQEVIEEVTEEVVETVEDPITTEESEVAVEEKKEEVVEKKEEVTPPQEEVKEEVKPKPKPQPVINNKALMGGKKTNSDKKDPASNNQGDERALMGNQGDPEGKKNTDGKSPGGADIGGVSYSLDGWKWQRPPAEKDDSQIDGVIKFAIDVDDRGDVLRVAVIPGTTISDNTIVEFYKKQVQNLRFVQLDPSKSPAAISKGEVTFVIKTN